MNQSGWEPVDYERVNQLKNNNNNNPSIQSYSMISPSDVPSHFLVESDESFLTIKFRYLYENEKKSEESILNDSIKLIIGKNSKKIYEIITHKKRYYEALELLGSTERDMKEQAKNKVKKNSYSAISEIYKQYIKDFSINGLKLAF